MQLPTMTIKRPPPYAPVAPAPAMTATAMPINLPTSNSMEGSRRSSSGNRSSRSHTDDNIKDDFLMNHPPGPLNLIYGPESPIKLSDITRHLTVARKRRRTIDHLSFLGCHFSDGARAVFRKLGKKLQRVDTSMKELAISGIPSLGNEELSSLAPFLNKSTTLRSLDLTGATFTSAAIEELRPFFSNNKALEVLVLGENPCIGDEGVHVLVTSLLETSVSGSSGQGKGGRGGRLQVLALDSCGIGIEGVTSISNILSSHPPPGGGTYLHVLELSKNYIGDLGAEILADAIIRGHHRLGHLFLNCAEIGDGGALAFGRLLLSNQSLITLSLQHNTRITNLGASCLLDALLGSPSIKSILESNHTLKSMNLRGCSLISPTLLQLTTWHSLHIRILTTKDAIIQWKVEYHLKNNAECGLGLDHFDLELMPHMLAFFGKASGMTSIFNAMKSMPQLYTMYDPNVKCVDELPTKGCEPTMENTPFLDQFKTSTVNRSMKKYYAIFVNRIPSHRSIYWHRNIRMRIDRESNSNSCNKSKHSACHQQLQFLF